jgi:hypothetical protein
MIAILTLSALSACAPFASLPGPVTLTTRDTPAVAHTIVEIIRKRVPPGQSALHLGSPADGIGQAIAAEAVRELKAQGYVLGDSPQVKYRISFAVAPLKAAALLTVTIDGGAATMLLSRDATARLVTISGLSFREAAQ